MPQEPPSGWKIAKVLALANQHLMTLHEPEDYPEDYNEPDDESYAKGLLAALERRGADISGIIEELALASRQAKNDAEAVKALRDQLKLRQERRERREEACKRTLLSIMSEFPELFPPGPKSKSLLVFKGILAGARVQRGHDGVQIIDEDKLMKQDRFVERVLNTKAVKTAVVEDGEVIDGAELKNGAPFIVVTVS